MRGDELTVGDCDDADLMPVRMTAAERRAWLSAHGLMSEARRIRPRWRNEIASERKRAPDHAPFAHWKSAPATTPGMTITRGRARVVCELPRRMIPAIQSEAARLSALTGQRATASGVARALWLSWFESNQ